MKLTERLVDVFCDIIYKFKEMEKFSYLDALVFFRPEYNFDRLYKIGLLRRKPSNDAVVKWLYWYDSDNIKEFDRLKTNVNLCKRLYKITIREMFYNIYHRLDDHYKDVMYDAISIIEKPNIPFLLLFWNHGTHMIFLDDFEFAKNRLNVFINENKYIIYYYNGDYVEDITSEEASKIVNYKSGEETGLKE